MDINEQYEKLYTQAVTEVTDALNMVRPGNFHSSDRAFQQYLDYIAHWADVVQKFAPPTHGLDLDLEAVEAIRRSYTKQ